MSKLASIEKIADINVHPNADNLELAIVCNYQAIVKKGQYNVGDLVIFIQPDTVLPDGKEWAAFYKSKSNRVKAIKLRKSWSFGIVESFTNVGLDTTQYKEGDEVSDILGIIHYEPPAPSDLSAKGGLPFGIPKTDEERYQNLDEIPYGEVVDVSQKIDGSSVSIFCKRVENVLDYVTGITSRSLELKPECENKYTMVSKQFDLVNKLKSYCEKYNVNLALRGELYGNNTQGFAHNPHAKKSLGFALFSVYNLDTLQYEGKDSSHYYVNVGKELNIETVPLLEENVILTPALIKKYAEEIDNINGSPFEGVVIKLSGGRSFKVINLSYDSKK